jgi:chromosome segregation ATPase
MAFGANLRIAGRLRQQVGFIFFGALIAFGCGKGSSPVVGQAEKALTQAQKEIEKAAESIASMREQSQELQKKIDQQQAKVDSLIEKRLVLYQQQLADYEARVQRLPAEKETELKSSLAELKARVDGLANNFRAYRDAPPEKSAEELRRLENGLADFEAAYQKLQAEIQPS